MENIYVSERVVNISECERHIQSAWTITERLREEVENEDPSLTTIDELTKDLHREMVELKYFEFLVERRKTVLSCQ